MPAYRIEFSPQAYRQFGKLTADTRRRLTPHIEALAEEPRPPHAERLPSDLALWRIRIGAYRVVYTIEDERLVVLVIKLGHRRDVYRDL